MFLGQIFFVPEKKIVSLKKTLKKYFIIGSQCRGFQFMLILDLWGISFPPVVVVGLGRGSAGACEAQPGRRQGNGVNRAAGLALVLQATLAYVDTVNVLLPA